jgi:hypothetical protein
VQADSVSDSDSENRNKNEEIIPLNRLTQTVCTDPPAPATTIRTRTDKQRTFFAPTGADCWNRSRNLNLPALPTATDSRNRESEPESACTNAYPYPIFDMSISFVVFSDISPLKYTKSLTAVFEGCRHKHHYHEATEMDSLSAFVLSQLPQHYLQASHSSFQEHFALVARSAF